MVLTWELFVYLVAIVTCLNLYNIHSDIVSLPVDLSQRNRTPAIVSGAVIVTYM